MHLYEITGDMRNIVAMLDEVDSSDTAGLEAVSNALTQIGEEFDKKALAVVHVITNHQADVDAVDAEIARLAARKKAIVSRRDWLEGYLLHNMQMTGITEIKHPAFTIRLRNNPESVVIAADAVIPAEFMREPPPPKAQPDKTAIKKALQEGVAIPGCSIERKQRIEIK